MPQPDCYDVCYRLLAVPDNDTTPGEIFSVATGADGKPLFSFVRYPYAGFEYRNGEDAHRAGGTLHIAYCREPACLGVDVYPLDVGATVGPYNHLTLRPSGEVIIVYSDAGNGGLRLTARP